MDTVDGAIFLSTGCATLIIGMYFIFIFRTQSIFMVYMDLLT